MTSKEITLSAMRSMGKADALDLQTRINGGEMDDTAIIDEEEKVPYWDANKDYTGYAAGFAVAYDIAGDKNIFGLLIPHNASHYPGVTPNTEDGRAMWGLKHTKNPHKARGYVRPLGISGVYMTDECYKDDTTVYISTMDNNAYTYEEYPQGWKIWDGGESV